MLGQRAAFMPLKLTGLATLEDVTGGDWRRLRRICGEAQRQGLAVLLDAEQSPRQAAVHQVAREAARGVQRKRGGGLRHAADDARRGDETFF